MADNDIILTERESRIAIVLFEIMKPQIKQFFESQSLEIEMFWKEQMVPNISKDVREKIMSDVEDMIDKKLDGFKASEIDINEHESAINDMIDDYIRYNVTITSTID